MPELSPFHRELISRGTLVVLALLLLYGGYRCIRTGMAWQADFDAKHPEYVDREERGTSGALIPYLGGAVLLLLGGFLGFMGVTPSGTFGEMMGPPNLDTGDLDDD
jgi:hypothetical protein